MSVAPEGPGIDRRGLAVIAWLLGFLVACHVVVELAGLRFMQGVNWPTDLFAFQHLEHVDVDVAVIGSSRASFAISPSAVDACLEQRLDRATTTVNLARSFLEIETTSRLLPQLFPDGETPAVLVLAVSEETVDDYTPYASGLLGTYGGLVDIPMALARARDMGDVETALWPIGRPVGSLAMFLARRYRQDDHLRWMMVHHGGGQFCFERKRCEVNNARIMSEFPELWGGRLMRAQRRGAELRFERYGVGEGAAHRAVMDILAWARSREVEVLVVEEPVHWAYRDLVPPEATLAFRAYLDRLADEPGVELLTSARHRQFRGRRLYVDPTHMSELGSELFSDEVCQRGLVPLLERVD